VELGISSKNAAHKLPGRKKIQTEDFREVLKKNQEKSGQSL
jgi:hypothetical protein